MTVHIGGLEKEFSDFTRAEVEDCFKTLGKNLPKCREVLRARRLADKTTTSRTRVLFATDAKKARLAQIDALYTAMKKAPVEERRKRQEAIDSAVIAHNSKRAPSALPYYDLHGMSRDGALRYAKQVVASAKAEKRAELQLETGRGNHSGSNGPVIKQAIIGYLKQGNYRFEVEPENPGIVVVVLRRP